MGHKCKTTNISNVSKKYSLNGLSTSYTSLYESVGPNEQYTDRYTKAGWYVGRKTQIIDVLE